MFDQTFLGLCKGPICGNVFHTIHGEIFKEVLSKMLKLAVDKDDTKEKCRKGRKA